MEEMTIRPIRRRITDWAEGGFNEKLRKLAYNAAVRKAILRAKGYTVDRPTHVSTALNASGQRYVPTTKVASLTRTPSPDSSLAPIVRKRIEESGAKTTREKVRLALVEMAKLFGRVCWTACRSVATLAGVSHGTAARHLEAMVAAGSIRIVRTGKPHGVERKATVYDFGSLFALSDRPLYHTHRTPASGARYRTYAEGEQNTICVCLTLPEWVEEKVPEHVPKPPEPVKERPAWCPF